MAGVISLGPDDIWSASSWLFNFAVDFLAERVAEPELKAALEEIVKENLGWLDLGEYGPERERELRRLLRSELVGVANATLPDDMGRRADVLENLRALADSV
jgi:hypothetical protein